ncbi:MULTISPECIES: NAD(P)-binding domain-containing protein [unclassified Paenibacillus]|uniref:NAD(P)-binding domain-containing protein n=1 Tax=unclassified Paenibacillus TaxID=185978 RepID=UPI00070E217F|nr:MULTISPECIES: NAD(P)-binding domain-containing protein [unclassified Paenibacillus]KQX52011.1 tartronate semialdehyde reductase [Paenibacillus sp. Root444D2]KRE50966.1 tartronate semialdehyde reductase [Paenibacillus sp. Soil724D2]
MKRIGFIGLGTMGKPMAANLIQKGFMVTVYNRTAEKADELAHLGAEMSLTPAEVARSSDVLITMLSNDASLLETFYSEQGILSGIHPALTIIDSSTVAPQTSQKLAEELAAHFVDFLDAPVTGSKPAAEAGTLTFMVGGSQEVFDEHQDVFLALGSKALYLGPSGSGSYAKLAHNTMVGINLAGLAEGLSIAVKAGVNPAQFLDIVRSGGANSKMVELKGDKIIDRDFSNQFSLKLMLKDLQLAQEITGKFQLPTPMLQSATNLFQIGLSKGLGEEDLSSVIQCYEEWMGQQVVRPSEPVVAAEKPASPLSGRERRRNTRVKLDISLKLSIYQWEQEGSFSGQNIDGTLFDLSESGLQITSAAPLAPDMFIVIHFPQEAELPPITARVIRIEPDGRNFRYGCMLSALPPYVRIKLEQYIEDHIAYAM